MIRILTLTAVIVLAHVGLVSSSAVFEVDLLRYEALPNKCCDGFRNVHFGPLKCNECDPYFKICLRQLPSGSSHCVKTSRENNVHTKDLTNGNIQPNHLSMSLQNWQGSLLVDVDINDFDSVGKDDDIDHLFYTYSGQPDPSSKTVAINGTKVRLTIAIRIYCSTNYFGADCSKYCINGSNSYCDRNGITQCNPGFSGAPNCLPNTVSMKNATTHPPVQSTPTPSPTNAPSQASVSETQQHTTAQQSNNSQRILFTTVHGHAAAVTESSEGQTTETSIGSTSSQPNASNSSKTAIRTTRVPGVTSQPGQVTDEDVSNSPSTHRQKHDPISVSTNGPKIGIDSATVTVDQGESSVISGATTMDSSVWPRGDNTTEGIFTGESTGTSSTLPVSSTTPAFDIPEPIELYSCNMLVQGHRAGVHTLVVSVIYSALSAHPTFVPNNLLGVNAMASTFEVTDNGHEVTDVSYVVNYNGQILRSESVVEILTQPPSSGVLDQQLEANNIQKYNPKSLADTSSRDTPKKWMSSHLPFVIVMSCIIAILLVIPVLFIIRRVRKRKCLVRNIAVDYNKSQKSSDSYDTAFSMENPLYDYENNEQPYKFSFP